MGTCYVQILLRELELEEAFEQFRGGWKAKTLTSEVLREATDKQCGQWKSQ